MGAIADSVKSPDRHRRPAKGWWKDGTKEVSDEEVGVEVSDEVVGEEVSDAELSEAPEAPEPVPLQPQRATELMKQVGATVLYEKILAKTDVKSKGGAPRVSINNEFAEQVLPQIHDPTGIKLSAMDVFGNRHHVTLRFNNSLSRGGGGRDYFFQGLESLLVVYKIKEGDVLSIAKAGTGPDAQIVIGGRVADDGIGSGMRCNKFWLQKELRAYLRDADAPGSEQKAPEPVPLPPDRANRLMQQLNVTNIYEKIVNKTDWAVGLTGSHRIFLNREFARLHLPPVEADNKDGIDVPVVDVFGGAHQMRLRYQVDNTYGDRPFLQDPLSLIELYNLKVGDVLMVAKDSSGRIIVCGRKATDADTNMQKADSARAKMNFAFNPWNAKCLPSKQPGDASLRVPHAVPNPLGKPKSAVDLSVKRVAGSMPDRQPHTMSKTEPKKPVTVPPRELPPRPKTDEITELRASIQAAGKDFLGALRSLQAAATQMMTLNTTLKTFTLRSELQAEQVKSVAKGARGLMNHILRPKAEFRNANDMGLERVWPMNDFIMKPVSTLYKTANALCEKADLPLVTDGGVLEAWQRSKQQIKADQFPSEAHTADIQNTSQTPAACTPRSRKRERDGDPLNDQGSVPDAGLIRTPSRRRDHELFPTTGSKVRDDALKILAHSLASSAATPFELAVDMEAAVFERFPPTEKGTFPDEYYSTVMGARDVLNVDSVRCREIFRLMVLEGFISPGNFVSGSAEELNAQCDAFRTKLA